MTGATSSLPSSAAEDVSAVDAPCPDADLLALRDHLREMLVEWKRRSVLSARRQGTPGAPAKRLSTGKWIRIGCTDIDL